MNSGLFFRGRIYQYQKNIYLLSYLFSLVFVFNAALFPFKFSPANGVKWLSQGAGLYFNGNGIVYSKHSPDGYASSFRRAISIEIHFKERLGDNNSGPRELISLYDGAESPPLLIGMWFSQVFLYSRFEHNRSQKWYNQFRPNKKILQGEEYYIAAVYGEREKALYCNGKLIEKKAANFQFARHEEICGRIIVGSSPFCKNGWMGEIRGIALYDYALSSSEVINHYNIFINHGLSALCGIKGLFGLYDFHAKNGNVVQNIAGSAPSLYIPEVCSPVKKTIMHDQRSDMRIGSEWINDFVKNVILFIPSGFLLARFFSYIKSGKLEVLFFVCLVCAGISFCLEIAQLFIPVRSPCFYDIFANMLGAGVGSIFHLALSMIKISNVYRL
jgi:hypothetical protein